MDDMDRASQSMYGSQEYWFDNKIHSGEDNFGSGYYTNEIYKQVILNLRDIPKDGFIVVLGANRCVSFEILCNYFGYDRCIGYDLYNPTRHRRVVIKDVLTLSDVDNIPIAFCHNDIGSFPTTPLEKIAAQEWAAKNVVSGGYFLGRNNKNAAKYEVEEFMTLQGFKNYMFEDLQGFFGMSKLDGPCVEGHMLSKKI